MAFYDYALTEHVQGKHELSEIEEVVGFSGLVYRLNIWRIYPFISKILLYPGSRQGRLTTAGDKSSCLMSYPHAPSGFRQWGYSSLCILGV